MSIGADNVGVYIVFFNINRTNLWQMIAIELVLLAPWCPRLLGSVDRKHSALS